MKKIYMLISYFVLMLLIATFVACASLPKTKTPGDAADKITLIAPEECGGCGRTAHLEMENENVKVLKGGWSQWINLGYPTEKGEHKSEVNVGRKGSF
jgi:uncharacterized protein YcnI